MRITTLLLLVAIATPRILAQTSVGTGSFTFSSGVHPTFTFLFEGTDAKSVESFWRDDLKRISQEVSNKKEIVGSGVLLPQVSPDTVRVLVKAEQRKGNPMVTAHVAIFTKAGWLGPEDEAKAYEAATAFVQERSTELRRRIAQETLEKGEKALSSLQRDLDMLKREHERMEGQVEKSNERAADAVVAQETARKELEALEPKIAAQRETNIAAPTEANAKALADLMKQQDRLNDKLRRAQDEERSMQKKVEDLTWEIKKNVEDQGRKTTEVTAQETVVKELRAKLDSIR